MGKYYGSVINYIKNMEQRVDKIEVGCQVDVQLVDREGGKEQLRFVIVDEKAADFSNGLLGANTPLAMAILGEHAGSTIPYLKDDIFSIEILSVSYPADKPPENASEKREALMRKAMREVQDTNAIVFASSFSGKWGDYDPDSIAKDRQDDKTDEA